MLADRDTLNVTVVRPAVIESALRDPFPGWNQGVNTSAPLTYLAGRGYRFYPAKRGAGARRDPGRSRRACDGSDSRRAAVAPAQAHLPALHFGSESAADAPAGRADCAQQSPRASQGRLARCAGWARIWKPSSSRRTLTTSPATRLPQILKQAAAFARSVVGEENQRAKKIEAGIDKFKENTDLARELVEVYRPYIQELVYTFHAGNIRALYASLKPADAEHHPFRPDLIDWHDYWINIHLPGLRRHIFPQLDLHTRGRTKSLPRHRSLRRYARPRRRPLRRARRDDCAAAVRRADANDVSRTARPRASRGAAARDPRDQAGRSRAADRRELARLGAGLLRDPVRWRDRGAARPV